eukprot:TRINITY_DN24944_c0_g1_i2.p1 TRINITY_DN24944_c0_g1~~TRINITY_DN24944_c0_g1_i2.p1  ORF type:complete len:784 (+),score=197.34 TRINITY_DN24944_c0_g1_i2:46-2352(+)
MARAACCALLLQLQCAAAITCTDFFGETKPGRVTIVSPDEGVSGSLAVLQGPSGDCRPPQPQRCSRYFQWYYDPGCVDAAAGAGGFDPVDGVLNDCRASAWKGRTVCLRSSAGAVTSCDCPASAVSYSRSGPVFHVAVFVAVVLVSGAAAACGLAGVTGAAPVLLLTRNLQVHDAVAWAQLPLAAAAAVLVQTRPRRPEKETDAVILVALLPLALIGGAAGTVISRHIPVGAGVVVMVAVMAVDAAAFAYTAGRSGNGQQEPESTLLPDIPEVPADTELLSRNSYMLDIRPEPERREQGSIVSADHIEISEVEAGHLPEVDKETEIIVLGRAGADRARAVTQMLKECGFCNVKVLKGGIDQWNRTVEPLYRGVYLPDDSRVGLLWLAERSLRGEAPPHVIDIRTSSEVEADRVAGLEEMPPTHIQAEDIISGARMPDCQRDACIVLVGQGSMQRCARAWEELSRNGYNNVRVLEGGLRSWRLARASRLARPERSASSQEGSQHTSPIRGVVDRGVWNAAAPPAPERLAAWRVGRTSVDAARRPAPNRANDASSVGNCHSPPRGHVSLATTALTAAVCWAVLIRARGWVSTPCGTGWWLLSAALLITLAAGAVSVAQYVGVPTASVLPAAGCSLMVAAVTGATGLAPALSGPLLVPALPHPTSGPRLSAESLCGILGVCAAASAAAEGLSRGSVVGEYAVFLALAAAASAHVGRSIAEHGVAATPVLAPPLKSRTDARASVGVAVLLCFTAAAVAGFARRDGAAAELPC